MNGRDTQTAFRETLLLPQLQNRIVHKLVGRSGNVLQSSSSIRKLDTSPVPLK